jgi:hypothetical protein
MKVLQFLPYALRERRLSTRVQPRTLVRTEWTGRNGKDKRRTRFFWSISWQEL